MVEYSTRFVFILSIFYTVSLRWMISSPFLSMIHFYILFTNDLLMRTRKGTTGIDWTLLILGAQKNFLTYNHGKIDTLRVPYDIHSLMHYDNKAFTKNFGDTIQALENPSESLGGKSLSPLDIKQILALYKCRKPRYRVRRGIIIRLDSLNVYMF